MEEKPTVIIRPSGRTRFDPRTEQAARELLSALASDEHNVTLELPDPGQFSGQNTLEAIAIIIGGKVGGDVLESVCSSAARWLRERSRAARWLRERSTQDKNEGVVPIAILGPDGMPLRHVLGPNADDIKDMTPQRRGK